MKAPFMHLRDVLHRATARYLKVTREGFHVGSRPERRITARILHYGEARTLYVSRRPECRSLDGAISITHPERSCTSCALKPSCTPQVNVELLINGRPYRLLLAFTSAANFITYAMSATADGTPIESAEHILTVTDRGHFAEIAFTKAS